MRAVMDELAPQFERATGKVSVSYDPAKIILRRIAGGETPDLIICGASALEEMAKQGKIVAGTSRPVACCGGHRRAHRRAQARYQFGRGLQTHATQREIGCLYAGRRASGIHFAGLIERLGIAEQMKTRAVRQPGGLVGELVAAGKAEVAVQQIPELMAVPGVELVGPLPHEVQATTVFAAGIFAGSASRSGARIARFPVDARLGERAQGQGPRARLRDWINACSHATVQLFNQPKGIRHMTHEKSKRLGLWGGYAACLVALGVGQAILENRAEVCSRPRVCAQYSTKAKHSFGQAAT